MENLSYFHFVCLSSIKSFLYQLTSWHKSPFVFKVTNLHSNIHFLHLTNIHDQMLSITSSTVCITIVYVPYELCILAHYPSTRPTPHPHLLLVYIERKLQHSLDSDVKKAKLINPEVHIFFDLLLSCNKC